MLTGGEAKGGVIESPDLLHRNSARWHEDGEIRRLTIGHIVIDGLSGSHRIRDAGL